MDWPHLTSAIDIAAGALIATSVALSQRTDPHWRSAVIGLLGAIYAAWVLVLGPLNSFALFALGLVALVVACKSARYKLLPGTILFGTLSACWILAATLLAFAHDSERLTFAISKVIPAVLIILLVLVAVNSSKRA